MTERSIRPDRLRRVILGACIGAALVFGCKFATGPTILRVERIDLSPLLVGLGPSQSADLTATSITNRGDTGMTVALRWKTTGGDILDTSNVAGVWHVTYQSPATPGTYLLIVTAPSGWPSDTATINVTTTALPVNIVTVNPGTYNTVVGGTTTLSATLTDSTGAALVGRVINWSTSDPSIASVNANGFVRTYSPGTATITATSEGKSGFALVTVIPVPVASISVSPTSADLIVGGNVQLTATTRDTTGGVLSGRVVTWQSSAPTVASVSSTGLVSALAVGSATITATSETKSASAGINVQSIPTAHAGHFVSPGASSTGDGSVTKPWTLATALAQPAALKAGDTLWLRGGNYTGSFTSTVTGVPGAPVIVRAFPNERVTIVGNLVVVGTDTWYWGFEIVSPTPNGTVVNGIQSRAARTKYINLVIHDASGTGIGFFDQANGATAPDGEVYGSLLYNNGKTNNQDHGVYTYNHQGNKTLRDNIVFGNWAIGLHAYATAPTQYLEGIQMIGNVVFNNGTTGSSGGYDILLGGSGVVAHGAVIRDNYTYRNDSKLSVDAGWYFSSSNGDLLLTNNYIVGTMEVDDWTSAIVTNNTVYSTTAASVYASGLVLNRGPLGGDTWTGNTFYGDSMAPSWGYKSSAGPGAATQSSFPGWKTLTGLNAMGQYAGTAPSGVLAVVRPNQYEAGRANIIVYNWALQSTVSVDVSGMLQPGDQYVVRNAQNFFGAPVLSGTYDGSQLQLPMTAVAPPAPIGRGWAAPTTGPTFNVFVLIKTS